MNEKWLRDIEEQEKELQFTEFSNETALKIGLMMIEEIRRKRWTGTIAIFRNGQRLFHYSFDGMTPDSDQWVQRKSNTVTRLGRSSMYFFQQFDSYAQFADRFQLGDKNCALAPGAFPIIIKNTGVIGAVAVSGLPGDEDHNLIVRVLREYLNGARK